MSEIHPWSYESLWVKACAYMQRALAEKREEELFPLWAAITLELVARAGLAYIHPALLAESREGSHLLYAFGYIKDPKYTPISIPTKIVFERCETIIQDFTGADFLFCKSLTNRRNEELHTGGLGFDQYPTKRWLTNYYRVLWILLAHQGKTLKDLLGETEANAAEEMIAERAAGLEKIVRDRISKAKKFFTELPEEEKEARMMRANAVRRGWTAYGRYGFCPACGTKIVIGGKFISLSEATATDSLIIQQRNILPTFMECVCCNMHLDSHAELDIVEMGGQYSIGEGFRPTEYFANEPERDDWT